MAKKKDIPASDHPKGLKEALLELPHIETVYVKGDQWHFVQRPGFDTVDREDVLGAEAEPAEVTE